MSQDLDTRQITRKTPPPITHTQGFCHGRVAEEVDGRGQCQPGVSRPGQTAPAQYKPHKQPGHLRAGVEVLGGAGEWRHSLVLSAQALQARHCAAAATPPSPTHTLAIRMRIWSLRRWAAFSSIRFLSPAFAMVISMLQHGRVCCTGPEILLGCRASRPARCTARLEGGHRPRRGSRLHA